MIIIGTTSKCQVGEVMQGWYVKELNEPDVFVTMKVLAESTYEEWVEYRRSIGRELPHEPVHVKHTRHFYKVHTD
jgi:hypothetical protein